MNACRVSRTKGTAPPTAASSAASAVAAAKASRGSRRLPVGRCTPSIVEALAPARQRAEVREGVVRVERRARDAGGGGGQRAGAADGRAPGVELGFDGG